MGRLHIHMQKNESGLLSHKINSTWTEDLNVKAETVKLLDKNIEVNLHDHEFVNSFLDMIPKAQVTRETFTGLHQN